MRGRFREVHDRGAFREPVLCLFRTEVHLQVPDPVGICAAFPSDQINPAIRVFVQEVDHPATYVAGAAQPNNG
ncbi:hypothetical protein B0E33_29975 (plasmid) [Roseibium algicola]|uniref:Uncharacterized protein n=1 Tax=Roseibium algicola TaxID=2857014 RepID=A0ABM6IBT9_9HYPH|nr:hypothetical protein B0E33_29975 [Roseibium aggregatum]